MDLADPGHHATVVSFLIVHPSRYPSPPGSRSDSSVKLRENPVGAQSLGVQYLGNSVHELSTGSHDRSDVCGCARLSASF